MNARLSVQPERKKNTKIMGDRMSAIIWRAILIIVLVAWGRPSKADDPSFFAILSGGGSSPPSVMLNDVLKVRVYCGTALDLKKKCDTPIEAKKAKLQI